MGTRAWSVTMSKSVNKIYRAETGEGSLERLAALETLHKLKGPEHVRLVDLVEHLREGQWWDFFKKITMADLHHLGNDGPPLQSPTAVSLKKKKKRSLLKDELGLEDAAPKKEERAPTDGGLETEEVAHQVMPFVEGNGEVTFEDLLEYTSLDRKVLRFHLNALVKDARLERIGSGKHAVYSSLG